jgi:hypothetical protein
MAGRRGEDGPLPALTRIDGGGFVRSRRLSVLTWCAYNWRERSLLPHVMGEVGRGLLLFPLQWGSQEGAMVPPPYNGGG